MSQDFCEEMRTKTKRIHDESDRLVNFKSFAVFANPSLYIQLVSDFYKVYSTIEEQLHERWRKNNCKYAKALYFEDILRKSSFEADLQYFLGSNWEKEIEFSLEAIAYENHIRHTIQEQPCTLVAYAYTMYMAMLAGGQILRRMARKGLQLPPTKGTAIFEFPEENTTNIKKKLKSAVNELELTSEEKSNILKERTQIFQNNNRIIRNVKVESGHLWNLLFNFKSIILIVFGVILALIAIGTKALQYYKN